MRSNQIWRKTHNSVSYNHSWSDLGSGVRLSKSVMRPIQKLYNPRGLSFPVEELRRKNRSSSHASLEISVFCKLNGFGGTPCDADGLSGVAFLGEPFDTSSMVHCERPWHDIFLEFCRRSGGLGEFSSGMDWMSSMCLMVKVETGKLIEQIKIVFFGNYYI